MKKLNYHSTIDVFLSYMLDNQRFTPPEIGFGEG